MRTLLITFMLLTGSAVAQQIEVNTSIEYTAQNQGYWEVLVNGEPVSQHTTEREAYEEANRQLQVVDFAPDTVKLRHNAIVDVEGSQDIVIPDGYLEPDPIPEPDEIPPGLIEIPGTDNWGNAPDFGVVHAFRVLNDDWAVTSDSQYIYAFKIIDNQVTEGWAAVRPGRYYRQEYTKSETTPLDVAQVVDLITQMAYQP